jgi:hypothetical protein
MSGSLSVNLTTLGPRCPREEPMHFADLELMPEPRLTLVAVGWLERGHAYEQGTVDEEFFSSLVELLVDPWQPFATAGRHPCGLCAFSGGPDTVTYRSRKGPDCRIAVGSANVFVPDHDVLYMAPSLVVHYIDAHAYRPPAAFRDAVERCPPMRSSGYLRAINAVGGAKLLRLPQAR